MQNALYLRFIVQIIYDLAASFIVANAAFSACVFILNSHVTRIALILYRMNQKARTQNCHV